LAPIQVNKIKIIQKKERTAILKGENFFVFKGFVKKDKGYKIKIDIIKANTPPILLGIERKIA
jgi:hypothetical protein